MKMYLLMITVISAAACSSEHKKPANSAASAEPGWSAKMQELSSALNHLLPLVSDSKEFNNPVNATAIEDATVRLKKLSHQVRKLEKPAADPAYESIAGMLDEDLGRAIVALRSGNRDYARLTIRESIGYCIQCHTQTQAGPSFPKLDLGFDPSKLSPLGQGDYYAATRQFDAAIDAYRKGISDDSYAKADIFGWERAARSALAIAVRFKESPKESKKIARAITRNAGAPASLRSASKSWLKAIKRWANEKPLQFQGENGMLERAESLIKEADQREVGSDNEHGQDILYLRASGDLHKWLSGHPAKTSGADPLRAKALYLAGRAAESSRELNFWTLHERYYELCIAALPNSALAKTCFGKLNESVLMGYTGSAGLRLPPEESSRLSRLREKAFGP